MFHHVSAIFFSGLLFILVSGCSRSGPSRKEHRASTKLAMVEKNSTLMDKIRSLDSPLYRELLGSYDFIQTIDLRLSASNRKKQFFEKISISEAPNGTRLKINTDPSENLEFRKIDEELFISTKNGPFHISDADPNILTSKIQDAFTAPHYFLALFGNRLFFEQRADVMLAGRVAESYQIVLLKALNKFEKKGLVRLGSEDSQAIEPLNTTEKTKSYGLLGQSTPLNVGGSLLLDKVSGLPLRIEIMGTFAMLSPQGAATADLSLKTEISDIGQISEIKRPTVRVLRKELKKVPQNAQELLSRVK